MDANQISYAVRAVEMAMNDTKPRQIREPSEGSYQAPNVLDNVTRAIIDANERREKSATHGMEIVAEAALEASGHAELVEALRQVKHGAEYPDELGDIIDAVLSKYGEGK